jgi:hypothetical protein
VRLSVTGTDGAKMSDLDPTVAPTAEPSLAEDILRGVPAIAAFTGEPVRRMRYMLYSGQLPAGQFGRSWVASKSVLRAHYRKLTGSI